MIKIGKLIAVIVLAAQGLFAASVSTTLSADKIAVGQSARLKISVKGSGFLSIEPESIPRVPGLTITYSGSSQEMTFINGVFSRGAALNYDVTPEQPGTYTIPPITFIVSGKKYQSRQVTLSATKGRMKTRQRREPSDERGDTYTPHMELSQSKAYVGEPIIMRYYILSTVERLTIRLMMQIPEVKGFMSKEIKEGLEDTHVTREGVELVKKHIATFVLIPSGAGTYAIGGGTFRVRFHTFPFGAERDVVFETKDVIIEDRSNAGKPPLFKGDTGDFTLHADYSPEPVDLYQEKKITVTVQGTGNLLTLARPALEGPPHVRVLTEDGKEKLELDDKQVRGSKQFIFTCIPEKPGEVRLGKIRLDYFNPKTRSYHTAQSKDISFTAKGTARNQKTDSFDSDKEKKFDFNIVYVLGIVFLFGAGIIALIQWERKRYQVLVAGDASNTVILPEPGKHTNEKDHLKEMQIAMEIGDGEVFLTSANKMIGMLQSQKAGMDNDKLERIKATIYNFRYGAGKVFKEDMQNIFMELKSLT